MATKSNEVGYYASEWLQRNDVNPSSVRPGKEHEEGFPSRLFSQCIAVFRIICKHDQEDNATEKIDSALWSELSRLYLWGEYFENGSLETALHQSEELNHKVISLLFSIGKDLLILKSALSSEHRLAAKETETCSELAHLVDQAEIIIKNADSLVQTHEGEADQLDLDSDLGSEFSLEDNTPLEDIQFYTKCLMQLVPALQTNLDRSAKTNAQRLLSSPETFRVSGPAEFYVSSARDKFPKADLMLVQRLGERNWQRRERIWDRINKSEEGVDRESTSVKALSATHSVFQSPSTFHDSGLGTSLPADSQYADSVASHTSFISSVADNVNNSLRVPPTPSEVARGEKFTCSICGKIQTKIRNRIEWKMHIFLDLQPYICTYPDCDHGLVQFSTRAAWANHEFTTHRFKERWKCVECSFEAANPGEWEYHIEHAHSLRFSGPDLLVAKERARITKPRPIETEECLLCKTTPAKNRRAFEKHVCQHLEEIALLALPRDTEEDSEALSDVSDEEIIVKSAPGPSRDKVERELKTAAEMTQEVIKALEFFGNLRKNEFTALHIKCRQVSSLLSDLSKAIVESRDDSAGVNIASDSYEIARRLEYTLINLERTLDEGFMDEKKEKAFIDTGYNHYLMRLESIQQILLDLTGTPHQGSHESASFEDRLTSFRKPLELHEASGPISNDLFEERKSSDNANVGGLLTASGHVSAKETDIKASRDDLPHIDDETQEGDTEEDGTHATLRDGRKKYDRPDLSTANEPNAEQDKVEMEGPSGSAEENLEVDRQGGIMQNPGSSSSRFRYYITDRRFSPSLSPKIPDIGLETIRSHHSPSAGFELRTPSTKGEPTAKGYPMPLVASSDEALHRKLKEDDEEDMFLQSKSYKCSQSGCNAGGFISNAILPRHVRDVHGMHQGHEYLCTMLDCERSVMGQGFPRRWNLDDHMKRIHKNDAADDFYDSDGDIYDGDGDTAGATSFTSPYKPTTPRATREFLCEILDCERSLVGKGFLRRWNAVDHMYRAHMYHPFGYDDDGDGTEETLPSVSQNDRIVPVAPGEFLCNVAGCKHSVRGNGFSWTWNLQDHMERVHSTPSFGAIDGADSNYFSVPSSNDLNDPNLLENFDFEQFLQGDAFSFNAGVFDNDPDFVGTGMGHDSKDYKHNDYDATTPMMVRQPGETQTPSSRSSLVESPSKAQYQEQSSNGRKFSTGSYLLRHQRGKSGSSSLHFCPGCGAQFTRKTARDGHLDHCDLVERGYDGKATPREVKRP